MKTHTSRNKETIKLFLTHSAAYPVRLFFVLFLPITTITAAAFLAPYVIAQFFNQLQAGTPISVASTLPMLLTYFGLQLYGEVIGWRIVLYLTWTMETATQKDLLERLFKHLTLQSMSFHNDRFGGSIVSQVSKLFGAYERFMDTIIFQGIPIVTSVVAAITILSFVFWQYAVVLFVISMIFASIVIWGSRRMLGVTTRESQASTATTGRLADVVTNIFAVKSYGRETDELAAYAEKTGEWRKRSLMSMRAFLGVSAGYASMIMLLNCAALLSAIYAVEHSLIPAGSVYLAVTYTFTVARQLWELNQVGRNYNRVMGDAYDMVEILGITPEITDPKNPEPVGMQRGAIWFNKVVFKHPGAKKPLFNNLQLKIKPGEKVGLVGHSGSGKTTLTRLLLRFNDINAGTITIDGQDITAVTQNDLRHKIAYVPQEPLLFHRTLAENIAYGKPDATKAEIEAIAKLAHAHEFVQQLPKKYQTLVGERGVKLSGGQRQRIAIARAMLKNAPILLLDEATSALDSESEALIQDALWKLMEGRTAIVIAHRLSTIQKMDRIIVMDEGKIVEEGSHKELIKAGGAYAELWNRQSGGFIED